LNFDVDGLHLHVLNTNVACRLVTSFS
jgi:hypothetical protein